MSKGIGIDRYRGVHRVPADTKQGRSLASTKYAESSNCYAAVHNGTREQQRRAKQLARKGKA